MQMGSLTAFSADSASWWQAGAAIASVATTVVLVWLTARYVRLTRVISESAHAQVQIMARAQIANQRAIAGALLEEVRRLQLALPRPTTDFPFGAGKPSREVPSIHPWIHRIIPDIAHSDPRVIGLFMRLERGLVLHKSTTEFQGQAHGQLLNARHTLEGNVRDRDDPQGNKVSLEQRLAGSQEVVDEAIAKLADYQIRYEASYAACSRDLDSLADALSRAAGVPPEKLAT
jgi:hypothetical protein